MSWTKLDDRWTDRPVFESIDHEARWHYLALIQTCSRDSRTDGVLPIGRARRASDVADPDRAHQVLEEHSLVELTKDTVRVVEIGEHIPPPHIRQASEKAKVRMKRMRAHKAGDHSLCLPDNCESAHVPRHVTGNTGTGQDGTETGQEQTQLGPREKNGVWPEVMQPGSSGAAR